MYSVKIIKDSINEIGNRITTFELTYPRFVHAEFMTHRLFSRNAASSRAIPIEKMIEQVTQFPVGPKWWGKNQSGMQAAEELDADEQLKATNAWMMGRNRAVQTAREMIAIGVHKQLVNRVLEPWMFITVIVTATEYENWFHLRDSEFAQPEIAWVARQMRKAYKISKPSDLLNDQWHLPYIELSDKDSPLYVDTQDLTQALGLALPTGVMYGAGHETIREALVKISTARCARVSYLTHDGIRDYKKDLELHDRCRDNGHWSAFEHCAKAMSSDIQSGNFFGWYQYRKSFTNEHRGRFMA